MSWPAPSPRAPLPPEAGRQIRRLRMLRALVVVVLVGSIYLLHWQFERPSSNFIPVIVTGIIAGRFFDRREQQLRGGSRV